MSTFHSRVQSPSSAVAEQHVVQLVTSADDAYAMPLAVAMRSVIDHLSPDNRLELTILDGGLTDRNKYKCERSWRDSRVTVRWACPDKSRLADLPCENWLALPTYFRFFMPELLDESVKQAVYLDADTLTLADLTPLSQTDLGNHAMAVAQDQGCPFFHLPTMPNYETARKWLVQGDAIANWRELGIPGDAVHFNAGVMVMNLALWRREGLTDKLLRFCYDNIKHIRCADQYALNAMLWDRWTPIDLRWNQMQCMHWFEGQHVTAMDQDAFELLKRDPFVLHFAGPDKPWLPSCWHPDQPKYLTAVERTEWKGFRTPVSTPLLSAPPTLRDRWRAIRRRVKSRCHAVGSRRAA